MIKYFSSLLALICCLFCFSSCASDYENQTSEEEESPSSSFNNKIVAPYDSDYYCDSDWTLEQLVEHFTQLGFTNITTSPCEPDDDDYKNNIFSVYIESGVFSTDPLTAGEEYKPNDEITIYYNEFPVLTVENCPDLTTVLTSKDLNYMYFAEKYDGRYVEFNAYVTSHITYDGGTSHIIDVTGGDYDGLHELGHFDEEYYDGLIIRIGERTWDNSINKSVVEGDNVIVSGRIDASWSEYYKSLYVEGLFLGKR